MITELSIEALGVIERLTLQLGPGLTAVTGETGAGKTMIVEALELVVGGRADATIVRHGRSEARVDVRLLRPDGTETVLTRVVPTTGRSRAYVDGRPVTVTTLAEQVADLVDLHGQHAHQSLLTTATQRAALDTFAAIDVGPLRAARADAADIDAAIEALAGDPRARAREIDLLRFQIGELDAAAIDDPAEDERLDAEERVLADATAHREAGAAALGTLVTESGARDLIGAAAAPLAGREPYAEQADRLHELLAELDDLTSELRDRMEGIDESPERLAQVRARRQLLRDLRRKYGDDLQTVMEFHAGARQRLCELESHDERLAELEHQRAGAQHQLRNAAAAVGEARRAAAPQLAAAVEQQLRLLAMPDARLHVDVESGDDELAGDKVQFLLAANPGGAPLPLTRVASGGELARTMLALRLVLSNVTAPSHGQDTVVFDEVDAGIGGAAAHAIAAALAGIGQRHQVLVVTHLAQVAAAATAHIHVDKETADGSTATSARPLTGDDRATEIARMLSGSSTPSALDHARELLSLD